MKRVFWVWQMWSSNHWSGFHRLGYVWDWFLPFFREWTALRIQWDLENEHMSTKVCIPGRTEPLGKSCMGGPASPMARHSLPSNLQIFTMNLVFEMRLRIHSKRCTLRTEKIKRSLDYLETRGETTQPQLVFSNKHCMYTILCTVLLYIILS